MKNALKILALTYCIAHAAELKVFDTGSDSEQFSTLKVYKTMTSPAVYAYKYTLPDVEEGTLLQWQVHGEMTNDLGFNVCLSFRTVIINQEETKILVELSEYRGANISKNRHHETMFDGGSYLTAFDIPKGSKIAFEVKAGSTRASPNSILKLEKDYGRMNGFLLKL